MDDEKERERKEQRRLAERYHDRNLTFLVKNNEDAVNAGNVAMRTLVLINGGAAIALLAFLGSLVSDNEGEQLTLLAGPLTWFAWGVAAAAAAMILAYFVSYFSSRGSTARALSYDYPYDLETPASKRWASRETWSHVLALVAAIVSLSLFIYGMFEITDAVGLVSTTREAV